MLKVMRYGVKLELFKLTSSVRTVLDRFVQHAQRIPDKPFIIYDGKVHTYRDIDARSNRLANVFLQKVSLRKGDCVALLMNNEPDFVCVWFGLAKVGCSVAFLNTNIKSKSLLHCFNSCGAKTLIVGSGKHVTEKPAYSYFKRFLYSCFCIINVLSAAVLQSFIFGFIIIASKVQIN